MALEAEDLFCYIYLLAGQHGIWFKQAVVHWQAVQNHVHYQSGFVQLVSEQRLCVVNTAPCEITHMMGITADYRPGFTDKMRIRYRMREIVQP